MMDHERTQADQCLISDNLRDTIGGGLNATLSDYLRSQSPVRKHYCTKHVILQ